MSQVTTADGSISMQILRLAQQYSGEFLTIEFATGQLFPNGHGTVAARRRVYMAIYHLARAGRLCRRRGEFTLALSKVIPAKQIAHVRKSRESEADLAEVSIRPTGRAAVLHGLNKLQHLRNEFIRCYDEVLSEVHRANGSAAACSDDLDVPTSYPMTCCREDEYE